MCEKRKKQFKFILEKQSGIPYYKQLIFQVKMALARGFLRCGDRLPAVRNLSVLLGVNPNTISKSYQCLESGGFIITRPGEGIFIASKKIVINEIKREKILVELTKKYIVSASSYGFKVYELLDYLEELQMCHRNDHISDSSFHNVRGRRS